jgi:transcriptional regulator with XRE-family HTH domain
MGKIPNNLKKLRLEHPEKWTQEQAAEKFGYSKSGYIKLEDGDRKLNRHVITAAMQIYGVSSDQVLGTTRPAVQPEVAMARVVGEVNAGIWLETNPFAFDPDLPSEEDKYPPMPFVPLPAYRGLEQFAVKVIGPSVNQVIKDGHFAVCVPYWKARAAIREGDLVVVQRRQGDLFEGTIKRVYQAGGQWELRPQSDDPRHQTPIKIPPMTAEADHQDHEVEIIGLVIWQGAPV